MPQLKEIGQRYRTLDDEEKAVWTAKANEEKARYDKELAEYNKSKPGITQDLFSGDVDDDSTDEDSVQSGKSRRKSVTVRLLDVFHPC